MRIAILAGGRIKERPLRETLDDYVARIRRYVPFDELELKDRSAEEFHADAVRRIPKGAYVVALEPGGLALTSEGFAKWIERLGSQGKGTIAFLIGAADGLPRALVAAADARLSLSTMTLPHRLARLVLAEQIYRAMTILRGEPYSR